MEKNVEKFERISKLADSIWNSKKKILDLLEICPGAKSEEELLHQAEGFLEEELKKWKLSQESKNEILNLLKKWVSWKKWFFYFLSRKLWTKINIKDEDSIKKMVENKWFNFDELWDSYIKYLCETPAIKWWKKSILQSEEKVKDSISSLKEILKSHINFENIYPNASEWLKKNEWKERSLTAKSFWYILHIASKILDLPISDEMFHNAIHTDIPITLFDKELQEKVEDSLSVDSKFISLVNEVKKKIVYEISKLEPTNWLVDFKRKFGWFIYREIDKDSDTIYCRIPIKSFWNKDLQYSIGKVDAYIVYNKDKNGIWRWYLVMDDLYDFPEWNFKSVKWILNKIWNSFQKKGKIMPYHWRISFKMPDIIEKDIKTDNSAVA